MPPRRRRRQPGLPAAPGRRRPPCPPGTELREVEGYRSSFRLAAREDGAWQVYEADVVPDAETGADLLDLEGKVEQISLVEGAWFDLTDRTGAQGPGTSKRRFWPDSSRHPTS